MALADDPDHAMLLHKDYDDQDILNEFLDHRVFDLLNANTPVASSDNLAALPDAKKDLDHHLDETILLDGDFYKDREYKSYDEFQPDKFDYAYDYTHTDYDKSYDKTYDKTPSLGKTLDHTFDKPYADEPADFETPRKSFGDAPYADANGTSDGDAKFSKGYEKSYDYNHREYSPKGSVLDGYETIRKELAKVKFGNFYMNPCPPSIDVPDDCLDFSPEAMAALPHQLQVLELPSHSRVETQIKLKFHLSPAPAEALLHVPQDLISKSKFCLQDPVELLPDVLKKNMLFMDTHVLTSDLKRSCSVCPRCIKREQKRALRSKSGASESSLPTAAGVVKNNPNLWADEKMVKKAIIFNCKEIVSFPPPLGLSNDAKAFDFSARIICYCRHHKELSGFRLLFVVRDHNYNIVAKHLSSAIMIMDRKKTATKEALSLHLSINSADDAKIHPLLPNSIDDSALEVANTDNTESTRKRKKLLFDDLYNLATNPMFNGSSAFSPVSNSDTNTSVHVNKVPFQSFSSVLIPRQRLLTQLMLLANQQPAIQRIIPAQGPIRGGIEVTLLGFNFRPGLIVKFGSKVALATHCWSDGTIVTYLPPAAQPGQVLVSFEDHEEVLLPTLQQLVFTYTDDTDRQLIELALQIVGLKMNGKLEDAKNIAKRIVGTDGSNAGTGASSPASSIKQEDREWYDNAHRAVEKLTRSDMSTEEILISFLALVDLPNCPIIIPNWQLCNGQGQTLLHLATLKNYQYLIKFLITHGCKIDVKDNQGLTPLFFASMGGYRDSINIFLECKSNWNMRLSNDKLLKDYCDLNVLDIFNKLEADSVTEDSSSHGSCGEVSEDGISKSFSVDSLNSLYMMDYGKHISRMVIDSVNIGEQKDAAANLADSSDALDELHEERPKSPVVFGNDSSDFADSELDSEDNFSDDEQVVRRGAWSVTPEDEDYYDDGYNSSDYESRDEPRQEGKSSDVARTGGLWQFMKNAVFHNGSESDLPTYDDLFPYNGFMRPKTQLERSLNEESASSQGPGEKTYEVTPEHQEDSGIASDSSEDMAITYINHPRKAVENDKMLLFFWLPVLVMILGLFLYMSITGYKVELIEKFKESSRNAIGNIMVGNERLARVFTKDRRLTV